MRFLSRTVGADDRADGAVGAGAPRGGGVLTRPGLADRHTPRSIVSEARSQARFNAMKARALALLRRLAPQITVAERERLASRMAVVELKYADGPPLARPASGATHPEPG